ncbi:signal recognition particle protein, partial [Streptomyces sp. PGLac3x]
RWPRGGGRRGWRGSPGSGGGPGRQKKKQKQAKGKRKSGNPMKRKAEEEAAAARREQGAQEGSPFGLPAGQPGKEFELPDEFKKFMG